MEVAKVVTAMECIRYGYSPEVITRYINQKKGDFVMIEKMSFVTLAGPKNEIDYLVTHYLSKHDIHLENALAEFSSSDSSPLTTRKILLMMPLTKVTDLWNICEEP